jgi:hypothetical protein
MREAKRCNGDRQTSVTGLAAFQVLSDSVCHGAMRIALQGLQGLSHFGLSHISRSFAHDRLPSDVHVNTTLPMSILDLKFARELPLSAFH